MKLINYEPETYQHGLLRTVSGLKLFIDTEPFYYGVLTIKCVAKVSLKPWNTDQDTSGDRVALLLNNREAVIIRE